MLEAPLSVHGLVSARASLTPCLIAIEDSTRPLDFASLERRSDAMAAQLNAYGVEPGVFVAICVERSADMVALLLAIFKCGGSYVALDPAYPEARLRWILGDIGAGLAVASRSLRTRVPEAGIPSVTIEELAARDGDPTSGSTSAPLAAPDPRRLAFITYTSGTTGRPKGVMAEHGSLAYFMEIITGYLALGPGTRFLQYYPLTWETQALDIYAVLAAGGTVIIPPPGTDTAGPSLIRFLRQARVTGAMLPPALLAELAEDPPLPDLDTLAYIGERLLPQAAQRWGQGRRLVNLYGPTEVTVAATASDERRPGEAPPIGRPLRGRKVYLLDADMRPVPDGEPGELCIGGRGLARGYWKLPELTREKFPADPFSGEPGARIYRTGDLARRMPDGNLDFLGRVDTQLNVRGQRIERGEIEAVLAAHPGVRSSAVVVHGEGPDARLVAFVTGAAGIAAELRGELAAQLPPVMVPSAVIELERFPLNQHGKIDFKKLAGHPVGGADSRTAGTAPAAGPQADMAKIWEDVLGVTQIGATDGFRALGGTSLQAVRALYRIREHFGIVLTAPELLETGTLAEVTGLATDADRARAALPLLTRTETGARHPASLHQRRLWTVAHGRGLASAAYNEPSALRLTGRLDVPALRLAIQDLAGRHEAFRSSFHLEGNDLIVDVAEDVELELEVEDLTGLPDPAGEAVRRSGALGAEPFDLAKAPLLRASLLITAPGEWTLVLVTHHTVADGLSLDVLDRDLGRCYAARAEGREPGPPDPARLRPRDFAAWQRATAGHPALADGIKRWRELLHGARTEVRLPSDMVPPASFSFRGGRVSRRTGPGLRQAVEELARDAGATSFAVCLLALAVLVARRTGQRDVLIGSPYAGRPVPDADDVIGFFTNTVVMRVKLDDHPVPFMLLSAVGNHAQAALEHQYVAFSEVVRALGARVCGSAPPLVQVVLAYQGPLRPDAGLPGTTAEPLSVDNGLVKADLTIEINETDGELLVVLPYSGDLFFRSTAERMLSEYVGILQELTAEPRRELRKRADSAWTSPRSSRCTSASGGTGSH